MTPLVVRRYVVLPLVRAGAAFPLALAAVPLALAGLGDRVTAAQLRLAGRGPGEVRPGAGRVAAHGVATLPAAALAFAAAALVVFLAWSGLLYPLRPDTIGALGHPFTADADLGGSWGGPTLAGAWLVHALLALALQAACLAVLRPLHRWQARVTGRLLVRAL